MDLVVSFYTTAKASEKAKTLALQDLCKHLDVPVLMMDEQHQRLLKIEGNAYEQLLKTNALNNFCTYLEITVQIYPLPMDNQDFWDFADNHS